MSFRNRSYEKELLDNPDVPFEDIKRNMQELDTVNTLLGGHAITCKGVQYFLDRMPQPGKPLRIAEIGCGGGDNLLAVQRFLQKQQIAFKLTGIDLKPECIAFAQQQHKNNPGIEWICSDYRNVQWKEKPDIIFSSLFCHHFTDEELTTQLQWLSANAAQGFFINDLHRHPLAYYSIRLLTCIFSRSYLVKNDAPLSVKRGFIKKDWETLLQKAGITHYKLSWKWAFRYLVCYKK